MMQCFAYFWREHGKDAEWFGRQTWRQLCAYVVAQKGAPTGDGATPDAAIEDLKRQMREAQDEYVG